MFDVIGKRRWFYAFSAAPHDPGLFFILLSPFSGRRACSSRSTTRAARAGRSSSTTRLSRRSRSSGLRRERPRATAIRTGAGYIEIKTEPIGLQPAPAPRRPPSASPRRPASASPAPSARRGAAAPRRRHRASPQPRRRPSASPRCAGAPPSPSPPPPPIGNTELPTDGKLGEMVAALEARSARSNRRPA